ncbi:hypothetical protein ACFSQE_01610 [Vogesella fluminis]|uniref:hypothetical protein n=1 Tax=Vogesella fluminis TaxID=1069161 RepID=UPI003645C049
MRHIEQRLFDEQAATLFELRFAPDAATLTTPRCGRLGFDDDGVLRAANRAALSALGLDWPALGVSRFAALAGQSLEHWLSRHGIGTASLRHGGQLYSAQLLPPRPPAAAHMPADGVPPLRAPHGLRMPRLAATTPAHCRTGCCSVGNGCWRPTSRC